MTSPSSRAAPSEASTLVSGSRRSHRIMGSDAKPVLQKAIRATALKNAPGMTPSEAFVSFLAFSDAHFLGVGSDSSLVFDSSFGSPKQVISLVRAKEISHALLAEAIVKASAAQQAQVAQKRHSHQLIRRLPYRVMVRRSPASVIRFLLLNGMCVRRRRVLKERKGKLRPKCWVQGSICATLQLAKHGLLVKCRNDDYGLETGTLGVLAGVAGEPS
jgi:hypothetical protein